MKKWIYLATSTVIMSLLSSLQADEPTTPMPPREGSIYQTLVMVAFVVLLGYFMVWRPERKRRQAAEAQRNSLKKGDRVSAMGIIGVVSAIKEKEQTVILRMVDGSKVEFIKAAVNEILPPLSEEEAKKQDRDLD